MGIFAITRLAFSIALPRGEGWEGVSCNYPVILSSRLSEIENTYGLYYPALFYTAGQPGPRSLILSRPDARGSLAFFALLRNCGARDATGSLPGSRAVVNR
jgi:hypothetical protein